MVIVYQNYEKEMSFQNLAVSALVSHFLLPFSSPFSGVSGNRPHILHMSSMISCCVKTAGGSVSGEVTKECPGNILLDKED
jgi:hypothetical protein